MIQERNNRKCWRSTYVSSKLEQGILSNHSRRHNTDVHRIFDSIEPHLFLQIFLTQKIRMPGKRWLMEQKAIEDIIQSVKQIYFRYYLKLSNEKDVRCGETRGKFSSQNGAQRHGKAFCIN
uniref:Uncharacterized protein n=1 Tax=Ditylenchus dipsaci TaxID=166011 RepID=A0A915ED62_9BILA